MSTNYKDAKQNTIGEVGENKVLEYLSTDKRVVKITDVRYVDEYQKKDIDFIVKKQINKWDCKKYTVEVKTDVAAGTYGNFFFEKQVNYLKDTEKIKAGTIIQGWLYYSECDFFFIFVPKHKRIYIFRNDLIKKYIKKYFPPVRNHNDGYKKTYGWCVKMKHFIEKCGKGIVCIDTNTYKRIDIKDVFKNL